MASCWPWMQRAGGTVAVLRLRLLQHPGFRGIWRALPSWELQASPAGCWATHCPHLPWHLPFLHSQQVACRKGAGHPSPRAFLPSPPQRDGTVFQDCVLNKVVLNKAGGPAPLLQVKQCPRGLASHPTVSLGAPTGGRALVPKPRSLSPGPPACLFSESQRTPAPQPCAAACSSTAWTSSSCGTRRKRLR